MRNIGELIERGKRKEREMVMRGEEEKEDILKKSKIAQQTPEKMGVGREDMERMFKEMRENMRKVIELKVQKIGEKMEEEREILRK